MTSSSRARRNRLARLGIAAVRLGFALGRRRPLRARVVLASQRTSRLTGNLAYIQRELERRTPPIPFTVLAYRIKPGMLGQLEAAWQVFRAGYHLATARVWFVDDWFLPMDAVAPRPGTVRVQTWHAAGAFKKIGYSVLDKPFGVDPEMISILRVHANYDLCLMPSEAASIHYMEGFRLPPERFTSALGVPRTDLFFDVERQARAIAALRARYDIPEARRVLLYAPTFRGDAVRTARYDDALDLVAMHRALAGEWVLLLRLHPYVRRSVAIGPELASFAIDVSDWPDVNELMLVADLLVTDYSSAIFEFALLGRPMAFLAPDHVAYERERGFYLDFRTGVPGPIFETTAELAAYVRAGQFDAERSRAFARASFDVADGRASQRVVDRVVLPALRGEPIDVPRVTAPGSAPPDAAHPTGTGRS